MEVSVKDTVVYSTVQSITVGGSPFTWTNPEAVRVAVIVSVGTVTAIDCNHDGLGFITMGLLGGWFPLNPGSQIKVTYALAPTMKYLAF